MKSQLLIASLALVLACAGVARCSEPSGSREQQTSAVVPPPAESEETPAAQLHPMMSPDFAEFAAYPADIYEGPRSTPVLSGDSRNYRTVINHTGQRPVDFAGSKIFATFGCGNACQRGYIVDAKSGRVDRIAIDGTHLPFLDLNHRADSRLLVAAWDGPYDSETVFHCHYQRYLWNGRALEALGEQVTETRTVNESCRKKG